MTVPFFFVVPVARKRRLGVTQAVTLLVGRAIAEDDQVQGFRKRVDDGYADAVETAGNLVRVLIEFSAGVQDGHDDFGGGSAFFGMDINGNAAAVVADRDGAVR